MSGRLLTLLKVFISLGLIVLLLRQVDIAEVWAALRDASLPLTALAMLLYLGAITSNAAKWAVLLRAQGVRVPFRNVLRHTFVGVFFNNFLPIIGGDVVRGYGLARETATTAGAAVSVVVDRLVGLLVFTSAGTLAALVAVQWRGFTRSDAVGPLAAVEQLGFVVTLGLLAGFLVLLSGRVRGVVESLVAHMPLLRPVAPIVLKLSTAVGAYRRRPAALLAAYGVGLTTILLSNIVNWLLFAAIGEHVDPLYVFIFNPIVGLLMAVPISIAGLGVNQNVFPVFYGFAGVAPAPAVAASLLLQLTIALTSLPGGLIWSAGRARAAEAPVAPVPPAPQPSDR
ncbi:MAG TPA: hypothetical protein DEP84_11985 [Chloroflexi bacterium]|nr:hypothetical protein [Chloroflexota bacterium]